MATNPFGQKQNTNAMGQTPKQESMYGSKNPLGAGTISGQKKAPSANVEQTNMNPYLQKKTMEGENKQYQQNPANVDSTQQMAEINSKLGMSALHVQAAVNKFLSSPTQAADVRGTNTSTFDPLTQQWKTTSQLDDTQATAGAIAEKQSQQTALTDQEGFKNIWTQDPTTGAYTPVSFQDYIRGQVASGAVGSFNEIGKDAKINHVMQMVAQVNALEKAGMADSPEYAALVNMIQREDDTGAMSSIIMAKQKFNRITGKDDYGKRMTWSGDDGATEYNVGDIASLTDEKIASEVDKGVRSPASSGLFGGDWGSTLRREIDTESQEYKQAAAHEQALNQDVYRAGKVFVDEWSTTLKGKAAEMNPKLKAIAPKILEELKKKGAIGEEGLAWFEAASGGDLATVLTNAVFDLDSGLVTEQRKLLGKYLGELAGDPNFMEKGQLATWVDQLNNQGFFQGEDGTKVKPTAQQKMDILNILYNPNFTDAEKTAKVNAKFKEVASVQQASLTAALTKINEGIATLPEAVNSMVKANVSGIASYSGSAIEELARERYGIEDKDWANLDANAKAMKMKQFIDSNPNIIKEVQQSAAAEVMKRVTDEAEQQAKQYESEVSQIQGTHIPQAATQSTALTAQRDAYLKERAELEPQQAAAQATQEEIEAKTGFNISLANPTDAARYNNAINTILRYRGLGSQIAAMDSSLQQIDALNQQAQSKATELTNKAAQARATAQAFVFKVGTPQAIISSSIKIAKQLGIADMESGANQVVGATMGFDKNAAGHLELNRAAAIPAHKTVETGNYTYGSDINAAAGKAEQEAAKLNIERKIQEIPVAAPTPAVPAPTPAAPVAAPQEPAPMPEKSRPEIQEKEEMVPNPWNPSLSLPKSQATQDAFNKQYADWAKQSYESGVGVGTGSSFGDVLSRAPGGKSIVPDSWTSEGSEMGQITAASVSDEDLGKAKKDSRNSGKSDFELQREIANQRAAQTASVETVRKAEEKVTRYPWDTDEAYRQKVLDQIRLDQAEEDKRLTYQLPGEDEAGVARQIEQAKVNEKAAAEKQTKEAKEQAASEKADRDAERKEMQANRSGKGAR